MFEILKKFGCKKISLTFGLFFSSIISNIFFTIQPFIFVLLYDLVKIPFLGTVRQSNIVAIPNNQNFFNLERVFFWFKNLLEKYSADYNIINKLLLLIIIFTLIVFCTSLFRFTANIFIELIEANARLQIRSELKDKILDYDLLDYKKIQSGYFQSIFIKDTENLSIVSGRFLAALFIHVSQILICIIFLISTNLSLTFILFSFFILHFLYNKVLNIPVLQSQKNHYAYTGKMAAKIIDYFNNFRILKISQKGGFNASINKSFFKTRNLELKAKILDALQNPSRLFIDNILIISVISVIFYFILKQAISVETAILFVFFSKYCSGPVSGLATTMLWTKAILGAYERIKNFLNYNSNIKDGEIKNIKFDDCIEFKNVCFKYGKSSLFNNISFVIKKNSYNLITGDNGSGKSTLLDLIIRLIDPTNGEILIDGVNIKNFDKKIYQSIFSYLSQEAYLIDGTIEENIILGSGLENNQEKEKLIYKALEAADGLFVYQLERGLQSNVGEGGSFLSGGERQKICIARALLRGSKIIIFDESTSGLDQISKKNFSSLIKKLALVVTILEVDHNKTPLTNENTIYLDPSIKK
jgi:ABC-type multidrug transport system fused ATPase/permease subunit